jgi:hypothetical protein
MYLCPTEFTRTHQTGKNKLSVRLTNGMGEPVSTFTGQREQQELQAGWARSKSFRLPVIRTERSGIDLVRQHLHGRAECQARGRFHSDDLAALS